VLVLAACTAAHAAEDARTRPAEFPPQVRASIDSLFAKFDASGPGCALGVFEHQGRRYLAGYGLADVQRRAPITPRSVFGVASVSKQFTAFAVLLLERERALSLDASIRQFLPELPQGYQEITLRQLLTHTSGLPEYEALYFREGGPDYDSATRAQQLDVIMKSGPPTFSPGTATRYTNTNYLLAAFVVERVTGKPLRDFVRERIFAPLGMTQSDYVLSATDIRELRAIPYHADDAGVLHAAPSAAHAGPTGVQTSIMDLGRWADNFYEPRVGDADVIARLQATGSLRDGTPINFAFGLERKRLGKHDAVLHSGVTTGTRAAFVRFPEKATTIALLCNRMDVNTERFATRIAEELFE
jgi:CubicO group peptidase (beta-lactamase class C family)